MSTVIRTCIVLSVLAGCAPARAEKAVLECIGDTWAAPADPGPHGRENELVLRKGGALLLEFRASLIQGWRIEKATLLLHVKQGRMPGRVRVAAMPAAWTESAAAWPTWPASPGRVYKVRPYGAGFAAIDLDVAAVTAHGLLVFADSGAVRFDSRETVAFSPYLLVEGSH